MSWWGKLSEGVKKKINPFAVGKDVGKAVIGHVGPVLSYALAPSLGPLAGIASSVISGALNFGLQWGLQKWEKWDDKREVNKAERNVRKSIMEFVNTQEPKVQQEKRNKFSSWLKEKGAPNKVVVDIKNGKEELPDFNPSLPTDEKSQKQIKKIQKDLKKWVSID